MKKFNIICIAGGLLTIIACFIPFGSAGSINIKVSDLPGAAGKIMWVLGLIIAGVGAVNKRWLHLLSLVCGLIILLIAFKWQGDLRKLDATVGIGSWLLIAGGAISLAGSIWGLLPKKNNAA
ncbi:MAG: hypothetical protein NTW29_19005 [Bacteroidetes bacterium]|nr:hypothetical protein [Bacteroidota bacterium]